MTPSGDDAEFDEFFRTKVLTLLGYLTFKVPAPEQSADNVFKMPSTRCEPLA